MIWVPFSSGLYEKLEKKEKNYLDGICSHKIDEIVCLYPSCTPAILQPEDFTKEMLPKIGDGS